MASSDPTETALDSTTVVYSLLESTTKSSFNSSAVTTGQTVYRIVIPAIGVFVILLNLAVVVSSGLILKRNLQPRTTYMFLGNIAVCDFITGFSVVFGSIFPKEWRTLGLCYFQLGLIVASTLTSAWSVGLIALDRFFYIVHGIKYTQWVYGSRVRLLVLFTWVFAVLVGYLPALWWEDMPNGRCWLVLLTPKPLLLTIAILGWSPLLISAILYLIILYYALKKVIQFKEAAEKGSVTVNNLRMSRGGGAKISTENPSATKSEAPMKWKAVKVVMLTTGAYTITYGPYIVACFFYYMCEDPKSCAIIAKLIASPLAILCFINSLLNPIIYAWWHKPFRQNLVLILCKKSSNKKAAAFKNSMSHGTSTKSTSNNSEASGYTEEVSHL